MALSKRSSQQKKRTRAQVVWKRWGDWRKIVLALGTGLFITALLTFQLLPDRIAVKIGQPAPEDIFAPRYVHYPDVDRTRELRDRISAQVPKAYNAILGAGADAHKGVTDFFNLLDAQRAGPEPLARRVGTLRRSLRGLSPELAEAALKLSPGEVARARQEAETLVDTVMAGPIPEGSLPAAREAAREKAAQLGGGRVRQLVGAVVAANLQQNRIFNREETDAAIRREVERVPMLYVTIKRGDLVLRAGEVITAEQYTRLQKLGLVREQVDAFSIASLALLAFGLVAVFSLFLYQYHPKVLQSFSSLALLAVVVCGSLLLFRIASTYLGFRFTVDQLGFLGMASSATGAMVIAALLCPQLAVFVGVSLALLTSVMIGAELRFAILSIVSSLVGVQAVTHIRNRAGILRAGLTVTAVTLVTALVAQGATQAGPPEELGQTALWAVIAGFGSVLLFMLFAAWLERPFRVTTQLTLLELSDPSHPLLRRLAMEAPGTHHHSIIVGNLAEAAAEAIGADGLFCRVASYYHDVGKVIRPHFFAENQSAENRHHGINPSLSSLIVTSHVKDGVELAEEYKLPPSLIAIIREHHGTCLIKYFYHQAVTTGEETTPALEYQFRYEGPRPQTKESGIIMLADSTEAAARTLDKPTPGRIRDLIERIVRDRLSDGQLDECELTFKDLEKITTSMTRSLTSLLHARVEYPVTDTHELKRLAADAGAGAPYKEPVGAPKALADTPETAAAPPGSLAGL